MPLFFFGFDSPSAMPDDAGLEFPNEAEATAAASLALVDQARDVLKGAENCELTIYVLDSRMALVARTRLMLSVECGPRPSR